MQITESRLAYGDNVKLRLPTATDSIILELIQEVQPIFLSHRNEDRDAVDALWSKMALHAVAVYIDKKEPAANSDSRRLVKHMRQIIRRCPGLLAYVTPAAQQSWELPLEIAFALEAGAGIATYLPEPLDLPSYLWAWPVLHTDEEVIAWGREVRAAPSRVPPTLPQSLWHKMKSLARPAW